MFEKRNWNKKAKEIVSGMKENKNTTNSTTSEEMMNTIPAYQGKDEETGEDGRKIERMECSYTSKLSGKLDKDMIWEMVKRNIIQISSYKDILCCSVGGVKKGVVFRFPDGGAKTISDYLYEHNLKEFVECIYQIIRDEESAEANHITKENYERICKIIWENLNM